MFGVEELQFIADLCIKHDVIALCDEVRMYQKRLQNLVCIISAAEVHPHKLCCASHFALLADTPCPSPLIYLPCDAAATGARCTNALCVVGPSMCYCDHPCLPTPLSLPLDPLPLVVNNWR